MRWTLRRTTVATTVLTVMVGSAALGGAGFAAADENGNVAVHFVSDRVNIRSTPSTSSAVVGRGKRADDAYARCEDRGADGANWVRVKDNTSGPEGWVRSDLVRADGPLRQGHCQELSAHYE